MSARPPKLVLWAFVAALAVGAGALWWRLVDEPAIPAPFALPWWLLAIGFVAALLCMVHVTFQGEANSIELSAVPILLGLVYCTPAAVFVANLLAMTLVFVVIRRQPPIKAAFNTASSMLELALAVLVFRAVLGPESAV